MSAWDDTGYALDDPKHPVNAGAGVGMGGRAKRADPKVFVCRDPLGEWVADQESAANNAARKAKFMICFDFPEVDVPMFAGWTRDGTLGIAPTLASAARFETEEAAQRSLDNSYGPSVRDFGVVVEVGW